MLLASVMFRATIKLVLYFLLYFVVKNRSFDTYLKENYFFSCQQSKMATLAFRGTSMLYFLSIFEDDNLSLQSYLKRKMLYSLLLIGVVNRRFRNYFEEDAFFPVNSIPQNYLKS